MNESSRVSDGCNSLLPWWLRTMLRFGMKGFVRLGNSLQHGCYSEGPWMGLRGSFYSTNKQSGLVTEAVVEARVKPSAAWMLLRRLHGWTYAALLHGTRQRL
ncbi:hypothetical protein Q4561_13240 [Alteromonas sp. 1_MG-2023]|uniref:hypothetical protein n=1 Tax=Alteromonas sp. 1_MG-2023 TaxID=3062669 RepID=UPI0026E3FEF8|nr:hypothetical protein [Alteromonas sp. 1_MG-2023]MDO6568031.1 hypothetical protein [Alteromonas sp. 1_MG-2023]